MQPEQGGAYPKRKIPVKFRVKIVVFWTDHGLHEKEYYYCLHCQGLYCRSGHLYHKKKITVTEQIVQERVTDFFINQEIHREYIRRQFETRFFMGRLRGRAVAPSYPIDVFVPVNRQPTERRQNPATVSSAPPPRPEREEIPHVHAIVPTPTDPGNQVETWCPIL